MYHSLLIVPQSPANNYQVIILPNFGGNAYQVDAETETLLSCGITRDNTVSTNLADWCVVEEVPGEQLNHLLDIVRVLTPNPVVVLSKVKFV